MCCMRSVIVENSAAGQYGPRQLCSLMDRSREFAMTDPLLHYQTALANQMASGFLCLLCRAAMGNGCYALRYLFTLSKKIIFTAIAKLVSTQTNHLQRQFIHGHNNNHHVARRWIRQCAPTPRGELRDDHGHGLTWRKGVFYSNNFLRGRRWVH